MPKMRMTRCQDTGFSKGMQFWLPLDLRRKFYKCNHCQKEHLTKEGYVKPGFMVFHRMQNIKGRILNG